MARLPRSFTVLPNSSVHKTWRGHNREPNLGTPGQKAKYLDFLNDDMESKKYDVGCAIHALCIMINHAHELFRVTKPPEFSKHMRRHHSRYGMYFNKINGRCGKVAQDRPKTTLIADDDHEMKAVFYIHANPIRANIVKDARNYVWSTHKLYAFGKKEPWMRNVTFPDWYLRLGRNWKLRQKRYRQLFAAYLKEFGRFKQSFLHKLFYGPDLWMLERSLRVTAWYREHTPP